MGKNLRILTNTRQMTVAEALSGVKPVLLTHVLTEEQQKLSRSMEKMRANPEKVEARILDTIEREDTRRPRFELGLGVWNAQSSRFLPLLMLHSTNNALVTEFDGRLLLIYQTPQAISPIAVYHETRTAQWIGDSLRLDGGARIENDIYTTGAGETQTLERPMQLLMRWYGFALTFPDCSLPDL